MDNIIVINIRFWFNSDVSAECGVPILSGRGKYVILIIMCTVCIRALLRFEFTAAFVSSMMVDSGGLTQDDDIRWRTTTVAVFNVQRPCVFEHSLFTRRRNVSQKTRSTPQSFSDSCGKRCRLGRCASRPTRLKPHYIILLYG